MIQIPPKQAAEIIECSITSACLGYGKHHDRSQIDEDCSQSELHHIRIIEFAFRNADFSAYLRGSLETSARMLSKVFSKSDYCNKNIDSQDVVKVIKPDISVVIAIQLQGKDVGESEFKIQDGILGASQKFIHEFFSCDPATITEILGYLSKSEKGEQCCR